VKRLLETRQLLDKLSIVPAAVAPVEVALEEVALEVNLLACRVRQVVGDLADEGCPEDELQLIRLTLSRELDEALRQVVQTQYYKVR